MSFVALTFLLVATIQIKNVANAFLCSVPDVVANNFIVIDNVSENTTIGTVLKPLLFTGDDSQILLAMSPDDQIYFDTSSRNLIVNKRLEVTELDSNPQKINLYINCTVLSTGVMTGYQIIVKVYDTNDHPPTFLNSPYTCNTSELTSLGSTVFSSILAADLDPGDQGYLGFFIPLGPYSSMFSFPVSTVGSIVLQSPLSYERDQMINLTIIVKDNILNLTSLGQVQPQFTATTSLIIHVIPAQDQNSAGNNRNPVFTRNTYVGAVDASAPVGSIVTTLDAPIAVQDTATGPNSSFSYTIVPGNDSGSYFSIDNTTGQLYITRSLHGQSDNVAFQVQATKVTDQFKFSRALILLTISNANDSIPYFIYNSFSGTVVEGMPIGTFVTRVIAFVRNPNEILVYSFPPSSAISDFIVDKSTGEIKTAMIFSSSLTSNYLLTVQASDSKSTTTTTVNVTVVKNTTVAASVTFVKFTQLYYLFNITHQMTTIGRVQATTEDSSCTIRYTIYESSQYMTSSASTPQQESATSMLGLFSIDANGVIRSTSMLTLPAYTLVVVAVCGSDTITVVARDVTVVTVLTDVVIGNLNPVGSSPPPGDFRLATIIIAIICGLMLLLIVCLIVCICLRNRERARETSTTSRYEGDDHSHVARKSFAHGLTLAADYDPYHAYSRDASENGTVSTIVPSSHRLNPFADDADVVTSDNTLRYDIPSSYGGADIDQTYTRGAQEGLRGEAQASTSKPTTLNLGTNVFSTHKAPSSLPKETTHATGAATAASSWLDNLYRKKDDGKNTKKETGGSSGMAANKKTPVSPSHFVSPPGGVSGNPGSSYASTQPARLLLKLDDDLGGSSSTETLVPTAVTPKPRTSKVSFVDNNIDYTSSQETVTASQTAMSRLTDEPPGITVYY